SSELSSPPEPPPPSDRSRQSRARLGCHTEHPPSHRRPAHTTAAESGSVASAPDRSEAGRARPSGRAVAGVPPALPTAPPVPSRPKTCPAASASSYRRIPPAKSSPEAASPCSSASRTGRVYPVQTRSRLFLRCFLKIMAVILLTARFERDLYTLL